LLSKEVGKADRGLKGIRQIKVQQMLIRMIEGIGKDVSSSIHNLPSMDAEGGP